MFSEAVIAYNSKQPVEALKVLDRLLKIQPDYVKALELKALLLKSSGKPEESRENYEALIKSAPKEKAGPYHFELGVLEYNNKKYEKAGTHFEAALEQKFNADASNFFLGLINFNLADKSGKLGQAQRHFKAVIEGGTGELKPPAYYYLGLIAYKGGYGSEGTFQLIEARSAARAMPDNAIAKDIDKAVNTALAPYGKASWFGNLSMLGAWNGNVSTQHDYGTVNETASERSSYQALLAAGIGRMSSPLDTLQWVASYRGTFNLNANEDTRTLQFATNTGSLYLTLHPLARTQYGLKIEGNLTFSGQPSLIAGEKPAMIDLGLYSHSFEIGPYMRRELSPGTKLSLEAYVRKVTYANSEPQSGVSQSVRATLQNETGHTWWNPSASLSVDHNGAAGPTFNNWGGNLSLTNVLHPTGKDIVSGTVSLTSYNYLGNATTTARYDKLVSLRLNEIHRLSERWTAVADVSYQINYSSQQDPYYFTQPIVSAGVACNF